ncbi:MAG: hypothetical protein LC754_14920 [Acidobacteria bacterium]|nr:hypothetical protein [Acidobacteriota bacterium]
MKDQNDFFEDLIDDEPETETTEFFDGEGEDDDDDEPSEIRTAVMAKNDLIALLTLKVSAAGGQIVRVDPRESLPSAQRYEDEATALTWFKRSLSTSRKNGWSIIYDGEPLFG